MSKPIVLSVGIQSGVIVVLDKSTHRKDKDTFQWKADRTVKSFDIRFKDDVSPFENGPTTIHGAPNTSVYRIDSTRPAFDYKYTVTVVPKTGSTPTPLDPHIKVDNMGLDGDASGGDLHDAMLTGEATFKAVVDALALHVNDPTPDGKRFLFPFGIQSISVNVTATPLGIDISVSGTTPV